MAFELSAVNVKIGADRKPFDGVLAGVKRSVMGLAGMKIGGGGGGLMGMFGVLGAGAGIGKMIAGASDLAETMSKVEAVFGSSAKTVTGMADDMAKAFGVPKREMLDAASQFGLIAQGMGQTKAEAADVSARFAKLAADAASFYNVPVDVALEKIRAGLTGESEPLKAFGVIMDETTMKAQAAAMGLARKGQELSNAAKFAARAALIEKGLATATGDLARTQDGAANQSRKFWGTLQNLADTVGTALLPAFNSVLGLLNDVATDMASTAESGGLSFQGLVDAIKSGVQTAGIIYRNFGDILALTGVNIAEFAVHSAERVGWLGSAFGAFLDWFGTNWPTIFSDAFHAVQTALSNFADNAALLIDEVWDYLTSLGDDPIEIHFKPLLEGFEAKTPGLELPGLELSDFEGQRQAIVDRMNQTEGAHAEGVAAKAAARKAAGQGGAAGGPAGAAAAKEKKVDITDVAGFSRKLLEASLGGDTAKEQLAEAKVQTQKLDEIGRAIGKAASAPITGVFS